MKQQWLLLLAAVGMSLGVLADCISNPCSCCHGYDNSGNEQGKSIDNYCTVSELNYVCWETESVSDPISCGSSSFVTYDLCWNDENCYACKDFDDTDSTGNIKFPVIEGLFGDL